MMMTSGFFRLLPDLPKPFWRYPISYIGFGAWGLQVINSMEIMVMFGSWKVPKKEKNATEK